MVAPARTVSVALKFVDDPSNDTSIKAMIDKVRKAQNEAMTPSAKRFTSERRDEELASNQAIEADGDRLTSSLNQKWTAFEQHRSTAQQTARQERMRGLREEIESNRELEHASRKSLSALFEIGSGMAMVGVATEDDKKKALELWAAFEGTARTVKGVMELAEHGGKILGAITSVGAAGGGAAGGGGAGVSGSGLAAAFSSVAITLTAVGAAAYLADSRLDVFGGHFKKWIDGLIEGGNELVSPGAGKRRSQDRIDRDRKAAMEDDQRERDFADRTSKWQEIGTANDAGGAGTDTASQLAANRALQDSLKATLETARTAQQESERGAGTGNVRSQAALDAAGSKEQDTIKRLIELRQQENQLAHQSLEADKQKAEAELQTAEQLRDKYKQLADQLKSQLSSKYERFGDLDPIKQGQVAAAQRQLMGGKAINREQEQLLDQYGSDEAKERVRQNREKRGRQAAGGLYGSDEQKLRGAQANVAKVDVHIGEIRQRVEVIVKEDVRLNEQTKQFIAQQVKQAMENENRNKARTDQHVAAQLYAPAGAATK